MLYQHDPRNRRVGEGHTIMKWLQNALKTISVKHAATGGSSAVVISQSDDDTEFPDTFLDLLDTPSSYASQALKAVRVNAGATALEFYTPSSTTPGGSDKHVQFNDGGVFGGDSKFTFDKTTGLLTLNGNFQMSDNKLFALKYAEFKAAASMADTPTVGYAQLWFKDDSGTIDAYFVYDGTSYSIMTDTNTLPEYVIHATVTASGSMTMTASRNIFVPISASSANITLTVAAGTTGFKYTFKRLDATGYTVTISAASGIDGGTTIQLKTQYDAVTLLYNGSQFYVV